MARPRFGGASFVYDPSALQHLFNSPSGPIARNLAIRAQRVESQAKVNASGRPGPRVRTGRLRSSIHWAIVSGPNGIFAIVGTTVYYAGYVEKGSSRARAYPYLLPALAAAR